MGQASSPLVQRVGRSQLWELDVSLNVRRSSFVEVYHRLLNVTRIFYLFIRGLALLPVSHL